jgi:hypothetical protein
MLSVTNKPIMQIVIMLSVVLLSVEAPLTMLANIKLLQKNKKTYKMTSLVTQRQLY